jgi:hypothetical protein
VIIAVPAAMPLATPDDEPIVAMAVLPELQVPPPPSLSKTDVPEQKLVIPEIGDGKGLTVTVSKIIQPVGIL